MKLLPLGELVPPAVQRAAAGRDKSASRRSFRGCPYFFLAG